MGLFDIFTGDPYKEAAEQQRQYLQGVTSNIQSGIGQARAGGLEALRSGEAGALGSLAGGTATARGDIQQYSPQALAALLSGQAGGTSALMAGQTGGLASLLPLSALAAQYGAKGTEGTDIAQGAYGLGPMAGTVQAAFQSSPGYKFQLDQGLESILRNANASGMAAGGNQLRESQTFGQGLANQDYGAWRAGVGGLGQAQQGTYAPLAANLTSTAGTGGANIQTGTAGRLADLLSGTGTNAANILQGTGTSLANLAQRGGETASGVQTGTGTNIANLLAQLSGQNITGYGTTAPGTTQSFGLGAAGQMQGNQNLWNLIGNVGTAGAKLIPGLA